VGGVRNVVVKRKKAGARKKRENRGPEKGNTPEKTSSKIFCYAVREDRGEGGRKRHKPKKMRPPKTQNRQPAMRKDVTSSAA